MSEECEGPMSTVFCQVLCALYFCILLMCRCTEEEKTLVENKSIQAPGDGLCLYDSSTVIWFAKLVLLLWKLMVSWLFFFWLCNNISLLFLYLCLPPHFSVLFFKLASSSPTNVCEWLYWTVDISKANKCQAEIT